MADSKATATDNALPFMSAMARVRMRSLPKNSRGDGPWDSGYYHRPEFQVDAKELTEAGTWTVGQEVTLIIKGRVTAIREDNGERGRRADVEIVQIGVEKPR